MNLPRLVAATFTVVVTFALLPADLIAQDSDLNSTLQDKPPQVQRGILTGFLDRLSQDQSRLSDQVERAREQLVYWQSKRDKLASHEFNTGMMTDPESLAGITAGLYSQQIELSVELAGLDARYAALESDDISEAGSDVTSRLTDAMERQVELAREALDHVRQLAAAGNASMNEARDRENQVLAAEIRLLEFRASQQAEDSSMAELRELGLDRADRRARLAKVEEFLAELAVARPLLYELETAEKETETWRERLGSFEERLSTVNENVAEAKAALLQIPEPSESPDGSEDR